MRTEMDSNITKLYIKHSNTPDGGTVCNKNAHMSRPSALEHIEL